MTATQTRIEPARTPGAGTPPRRPAGAGRLERRIFLVAVGVIALHVVDDSFLQPQPGTSAADHLVSGLVPLAVLGLAALVYARLRGGARAAIALVLGVFGIVAGIEAVHYTTKVGPSGDDFTGLLSIPAGVGLLGLGLVTLWTTRRRHGSMPLRVLRRVVSVSPRSSSRCSSSSRSATPTWARTRRGRRSRTSTSGAPPSRTSSCTRATG